MKAFQKMKLRSSEQTPEITEFNLIKELVKRDMLMFKAPTQSPKPDVKFNNHEIQDRFEMLHGAISPGVDFEM